MSSDLGICDFCRERKAVLKFGDDTHTLRVCAECKTDELINLERELEEFVEDLFKGLGSGGGSDDA